MTKEDLRKGYEKMNQEVDSFDFALKIFPYASIGLVLLLLIGLLQYEEVLLAYLLYTVVLIAAVIYHRNSSKFIS